MVGVSCERTSRTPATPRASRTARSASSADPTTPDSVTTPSIEVTATRRAVSSAS